MLYIIAKYTYYFILTGCFDTIGVMQYTDFVLLPPHITEILGSCPTHPHYAMLPSPLQNHCYIDIREGFLCLSPWEK